MFSVAIGVLVLLAVMTLVVVAAQMYYKNQMIADAANDARILQEHINFQLSRAVGQFKIGSQSVTILPEFSDSGTNALDLNLSTHPQRYGMLKYRVSLGGAATVTCDPILGLPQSSNSITLYCPQDMLVPQAGDLLLLDAQPLAYTDPLSGNQLGGALIQSVNDTRLKDINNNPTAAGSVTLTLASNPNATITIFQLV